MWFLTCWLILTTLKQLYICRTGEWNIKRLIKKLTYGKCSLHSWDCIIVVWCCVRVEAALVYTPHNFTSWGLLIYNAHRPIRCLKLRVHRLLRVVYNYLAVLHRELQKREDKSCCRKVMLHCSYRCTLYKRHITSLCCKPTTEILFSMLCDGSEKNNKIIDVFIMDKDFTAEVSGLIMDILALQPYHRWGAFPRPSTST